MVQMIYKRKNHECSDFIKILILAEFSRAAKGFRVRLLQLRSFIELSFYYVSELTIIKNTNHFAISSPMSCFFFQKLVASNNCE